MLSGAIPNARGNTSRRWRCELGRFYHIQTYHGTWLAVEAKSGRIVSCEVEKCGRDRALLIAYVPERLQDVCFLLSPFRDVELYLPTDENRSLSIWLRMRQCGDSPEVLFLHPTSNRYVCAAPAGEQAFGNVAIHDLSAYVFERFRLAELPDALVPADPKLLVRHLDSPAGERGDPGDGSSPPPIPAHPGSLPLAVDHGLIVDVGMSEGNDTAFYLSKGFRVLGVEADPVVFSGLCARFANEIGRGALTIVHRVASDARGAVAEFWKNDQHQGLSSTVRRAEHPLTRYEVDSINWPGILDISGAVPHYCKVDIEGGEKAFLRSMMDSDPVPTFISVEAHSFDPIEMLFLIGYRRFKLVNQCILSTFQLPNPAREGLYVANPNWIHASGPFGRELMGERWLDFKETAVAFDMIQRLNAYQTTLNAWFDCHAWMPD